MKILVVDDDRMMVKTICYILKSEGYETVEAYTGEEGVEKARAGGVECVLMDIRMPGMNGVDALKMILAATPDLPVVMMSAYSDDEVIAEAKRLGAYSVLTKPIDVEMILLLLTALKNEGSIFIIDDDPGFCKTMSIVLQAKGYRVETEVDPAQVPRHLEKNEKLVVLLDLKLGATNGIDVLTVIREKHPGEPVILVTGYREEMTASIEKGLRIGAHTCLYKPLDLDALTACIGEIRRRKHRAAMGEEP